MIRLVYFTSACLGNMLEQKLLSLVAISGEQRRLLGTMETEDIGALGRQVCC